MRNNEQLLEVDRPPTPAQITPSLSSANWTREELSSSWYLCHVPSFLSSATPWPATQRLPFLDRSNIAGGFPGRDSPFGGAHSSNRIPSKRSSPLALRTQIWPSVVCAIEPPMPRK